MNIVLGDETSAAEMRKRHTVLELETFDIAGSQVKAYCIVSPEAIVMSDMPDLDRLCRLHQAFVDAYNNGRYDSALDAVQHIRGRFSGELDSFYDEICRRITKGESVG